MYLSAFIIVSSFSFVDNTSISIQADAVAVTALYALVTECNKQCPSPGDFTTLYIDHNLPVFKSFVIVCTCMPSYAVPVSMTWFAML